MPHGDLKWFVSGFRLLNGRDLPLALWPAHGVCRLHTPPSFSAVHALYLFPFLCPLQVSKPPHVSL